VLALALAACGDGGSKLGNTGDYSKDIIGSWETWHWYYNIDNGESGFFDDNHKVDWVFNDDGTFSMKSVDGTTAISGKLEWKNKNQADAYLDDGRTFGIECKAEQSHEGPDVHYEIQLTRLEDKFTWTLQYLVQ
jgi:hypothetical protein